MNRKIAYAGLLVVLGITLILNTSDDVDSPPAPPPSQASQSTVTQVPAAPTTTPPASSGMPIEDAPGEPQTERGYFAPSLTGTDVDGELKVDEDGNLVVTRGTRDLFDYFLSTSGERSLEAILEEIRQYAAQRLPPDAAAQAIVLLEDYVAYKVAEQDYLHQDMSQQENDEYVDTLDRVLDQLIALRQQHFSPEQSQALFGVEQAYGAYALERMRIASDGDLAADEKARRLAELATNAPVEIREVKHRTTGFVMMEQTVEEMRVRGATETDILQYREQQVGAEEAQRLARIDAENADWERRYAQYSEQRQQINQTPGLSAIDREAALKQIRAQYFAGPELDRARVYDQVAVPSPDN